MNDEEMIRADIAVIGGGPAGLAAAAGLAKAGWAVALIAPSRPGDSRTTALLGPSIAFMQRAGAWPAMQANAAPLRAIRIIDATTRLFRAPEVLFRADELGLDAFGWNVPNPALVGALSEAAAGAGVIRVDAEATEAVPGRDGIAIRAGTGTSILAKLAVAADGRGSQTRERAGIAANTHPYPQAALVATFDHTLPHDDVSTEFHTETGPFTLVPLPGRRSSLVCVETPESAARLAALPAQELGAEIERRSRSLLGACSVDGAAAIFPLSRMRASRVTAPRLALIGEAAHVVPPIGAQGLNLGLRDIEVLAEAVARRDPGSEDGLARYERARRLDLTLRTAAVDLLNRSLLSNFLPVHAGRGAGMFALSRVPLLRRWLMRNGLGAADAR